MIDVVIVGAGPVGLSLALFLKKSGVGEVLVVDKNPRHVSESRATGIHGRTLEAWSSLGGGIAEAICRYGIVEVGAQIFYEKEMISTFEYYPADIKSNFAFIVALPQNRLEEILEEKLQELNGITIRRHTRFCGVVDKENGLEVHVIDEREGKGGACEIIEAKLCVGCDGAHSQVRKSVGIEFAGNTGANVLTLSDCEIPLMMRDRNYFKLFPSAQMLSILFALPYSPTSYRLACLPLAPEDNHSLSFDLMRKKFKAISGLEIQTPTWLSSFKISYRVAETYRRGKVLLAGDSAHIHSPVGGHGMNTGIQDAHNLAFKIAEWIRAENPFTNFEILDSYEAERRPVALQNCKSTAEATDRIIRFAPKFARSRLSSKLFFSVLGLVLPRKQFFAGGFGVTYSMPLSEEEVLLQKNLLVKSGERFPYLRLNGSMCTDDLLSYEGMTIIVASLSQEIGFHGKLPNRSETYQCEKIFYIGNTSVGRSESNFIECENRNSLIYLCPEHSGNSSNDEMYWIYFVRPDRYVFKIRTATHGTLESFFGTGGTAIGEMVRAEGPPNVLGTSDAERTAVCN